MILPNKYIALDIETTDSECPPGEPIQIGAVALNEDLSFGESFATYIKPRTAWRNPEAMAVNRISEEVIAAAAEEHEAYAAFEAFCHKGTGSNRPIIAAWGAYFDVPFLKRHYETMGRRWPFSYKCLDLKAIWVWEAAKRELDPNAGVESALKQLGLSFEGTPHDGLDDIKNAVRIIQHLEKTTK